MSDFLTHRAEFQSPHWLAIHVPSARKVLSGYEDANFEDVAELMIGYCNLLDSAGLLHYGDTEAEAIEKARRAAK